MKYLAVILLLTTLAGCSNAVPELHQYLLRADNAALVIASYIDGPGLILETGNGQVNSARDHQWAEPLRESLRIFLARQIAVAAAQPVAAQPFKHSDWEQRIDIRIDQLHGKSDGSAVLVAYWQVSTKQGLVDHEFMDSEPLSADGYAALVKAEKVLLERLCGVIAAGL